MAETMDAFYPDREQDINRNPDETTSWPQWLKDNNKQTRDNLAAGNLTIFESVYFGKAFLQEILAQDGGQNVGILFYVTTREQNGKAYTTLAAQGVRENGIPYNGMEDTKFMSVLSCPPECQDWELESA